MYLVKLVDKDRYWSEDERAFVPMDNIISPSKMDLDWAKRFAICFGVESLCVYQICNENGKVLKKYSAEVEKEILKELGLC